MLEKSVAAMLSAIEIYNKPDFKYREETFSVLCINGWELLLKAKVLNLASNKLASLYAMEHKTLKTGKKSSVKRPKKNRSGEILCPLTFLKRTESSPKTTALKSIKL
ncbi:DUF3644 domain-containing protein [Methylomicrobium sp. Wu6]|uniref:DUF3644 domain-containing protein n=1 Tax=Methylomicrobium sp. Wu6 TaxID=3107928 RepID=UPI002DD63C01|nr:DUF3644 domain-containing protein [Methylomicrobium sp. Wu6]MEC4746890.1 DUF3644 domain-containing protein [Methylomicrobium sp. Wu6]